MSGFEALARIGTRSVLSRRRKLEYAAQTMRSWAIVAKLSERSSIETIRIASNTLRCCPFGGPAFVTLRDDVVVKSKRQCKERICPHCHVERLIKLVQSLEHWVDKNEISTMTIVPAELSLRSGDHLLPPRECIEAARKRLMQNITAAGNPYALAFARVLPARSTLKYKARDKQPGQRHIVPAWLLINTVLIFSSHEHPFKAFKHPDGTSQVNLFSEPVHSHLRSAVARAGRIPAKVFRPSRLKDIQPWLDLTFKLQQWKASFELPSLTPSNAPGSLIERPNVVEVSKVG